MTEQTLPLITFYKGWETVPAKPGRNHRAPFA